jgi:glucokinase
VDIGGTKVAAGVVTAAGEVVDSARAETPHRSQRPDVVEATICRVVRELTERHDVAAVGIGAAGFIDATGSTVLFSPHLSWREEPLRDRVAARLGLPVVVENDANAAAWAEHRFGAGRGEEHLVCVTLGTGIGGAVVLSGTLLRGRYGLAGEFGHMQVVPDGHPCECGGRGCWEQYVSGHALLRAARALIVSGSPLAGPLLASAGGDPDALTGPLVTELARGGDPGAVRLLAEMGAWFGTGLANLAAAFDPGTFVIGGGVSDAGELLLGPARESFSRALTGRGYRPEARVVRAQLGPDAGLVGAADLARSRVSGLRRPRLGTQQGWLYGRGAWAVAPGRD